MLFMGPGSIRLKRLRLSCVALFCLLIRSVVSIHCPEHNSTFIRKLFVSLQKDFQPAEGIIIKVLESPPSECFAKCSSDFSCSAYFVNYRNRSCLFVHNVTSDLIQTNLSEDEDISYHRKACLPSTRCEHEWVFDELQGLQLNHYLDKTISDVRSSDICMSMCLSESTFVCRSARYDKSTLECILSHHDRRTAAEYFRQSPKKDDVVYIERQCVEEPTSCHFRYRHSRALFNLHRHTKVIPEASNKDSCEEACLRNSQFQCRSYQLVHGDQPVCLISPEDSASGPETTKMTSEADSNEVYFEKESTVSVV